MSNKISDRRAIRLIVSNTLVRAGRLVFQLFLNIFIWKQTDGDLEMLAVFNLIYLTVHTLSFVSFAPFIKAGYRQIFHVIWLIGYIATYMSIVYLWPESIDYIFWIAASIGLFNGMYWITYHNSYFYVTTFTNRWNYEWIKKSLSITNGIIVPSLIGWIITWNYLWFWYEMAFILWSVFMLWALFIWTVKIDGVDRGDFELLKFWKVFFSHKDIFRSLYTHSFTGFSFSNTVLEVIIPVMLFSYIWNELDLGFLISLFSIVSIIWAYIFWRFVDYSSYPKAILLSGSAYCIALVWFIVMADLRYMILFAAVINFVLVFFSIPQKVISDNVLHTLENYNKYRVEYLVIRELFLSIWWLSTFTILYFIGDLWFAGIHYLFAAMVIFTFISTLLLYTVDIKKIK